MAVRNVEELEARLRDAVDARKKLVAEAVQAEDGAAVELQHELSEEIANLSGVITTLEWVLQTGIEADDDAWVDTTDDDDDMIEIAEFSEGDTLPTLDAEMRPSR